MVRYADDFVCCFQSETEANNFYRDLIVRLKKFNLEIAEDKTKIIPFGRYAEQNNKRKGMGSPIHSTFWDSHISVVGVKMGNFELNGKQVVRKCGPNLKSVKNGLKPIAHRIYI